MLNKNCTFWTFLLLPTPIEYVVLRLLILRIMPTDSDVKQKSEPIWVLLTQSGTVHGNFQLNIQQ